MISPIHYFIHYILLNVSVLGLCLWINDSGLFVLISLTALSRTYFIKYMYNKYFITLKFLSVLTNNKLELGPTSFTCEKFIHFGLHMLPA